MTHYFQSCSFFRGNHIWTQQLIVPFVVVFSNPPPDTGNHGGAIRNHRAEEWRPTLQILTDTKLFRWVICCPAIKFEWGSTVEHNIRRGIIPSASIIKNKVIKRPLLPRFLSLLSLHSHKIGIKNTAIAHMQLFCLYFFFFLIFVDRHLPDHLETMDFLLPLWFNFTILKEKRNKFQSFSLLDWILRCLAASCF